jgi:excisionase family DNA binding protein
MARQSQVRKTFCTTREAAQILGVSLRTAQLWSESGLLEAWKTEGGHRRISRESVQRLLADPVVQESSAHAHAEASGPHQFSVLVAEDEAALRMLYQFNLDNWSLKPWVSMAGDGYEALMRIGLDRPDLLITDLRMPDMDGFRMLRAIRNQPELAGMAIIVVTGLEQAEIDEQGGLPEGIQVLHKPIPFKELEDIANRVAAALPRQAKA